MTPLKRPVRRFVGELDGIHGADFGEYIVTLYPSGFLGLRRLWSRQEVTVSLASCWALAVKQTVAMKNRKSNSPRKLKALRAGIESGRTRPPVDLGSFARYAKNG